MGRHLPERIGELANVPPGQRTSRQDFTHAARVTITRQRPAQKKPPGDDHGQQEARAEGRLNLLHLLKSAPAARGAAGRSGRACGAGAGPDRAPPLPAPDETER